MLSINFFVHIANNPAMKPKLPSEVHTSSFLPSFSSSLLAFSLSTRKNSGQKNHCKSANNNIELNFGKPMHFTVKPPFYSHGNSSVEGM